MWDNLDTMNRTSDKCYNSRNSEDKIVDSEGKNQQNFVKEI
jgi:hypothetical protein